MKNFYSAFNYQQWLFHDDYPDTQSFLDLFPIEDNTGLGDTATNSGVQHYYDVNLFETRAAHVRQWVNTQLESVQAPVRADRLLNAWSIEYSDGGWQALHNHAVPYRVISTVLYIKGTGDYYSVLTEPDGTSTVVNFPTPAGTAVVTEGSVPHGAYPQLARQIVVFDFEQSVAS